MAGVEVLHEHEGHPGLRRQTGQELGEGLEAPGGSADPDDGKRAFRPLLLRRLNVALGSASSSIGIGMSIVRTRNALSSNEEAYGAARELSKTPVLGITAGLESAQRLWQ